MTETAQDETEPTEADTYVAMFDTYVQGMGKIDPNDRPLIFHARKICQQLDKQIGIKGVTEAAKDSAYLQAVERLNKRRATPTGPSGPKQIEGQTDIFDYHED